MSVFCVVDDKHVPLYRILWVSADCQREGHYEVRLDQGESLWADAPGQRDAVLAALEAWCQGRPPTDDGP